METLNTEVDLYAKYKSHNHVATCFGDLKFPTPLWEHQFRAFEKAVQQDSFGFFFEMGTGKTLTAITMLRYLFLKNKRFMRVLILTPPITILNWVSELKTHGLFSQDDLFILSGTRHMRLSALRKRGFNFINKNLLSQICVTNYETLSMSPVYSMLTSWKPEIIIFDESHKIKTFNSKRTRFSMRLAELAKHRFLLSGTPVLNSPLDLFSQFFCLDLGQTFGRNYYAFRAKYFYDVNSKRVGTIGYFPNWQIKPNGIDQIRKAIDPYMFTVKKSECLDLPPLIRKVIYVDLSPDQLRLYKEMKKYFVASLSEFTCTAELTITKGLRLQQIVSGYLKADDGSEKKLKDTPRRKALKDLLEELCPENKVIVWCVFKENYSQVRDVCRELNVRFVECHGEVPENKKYENVVFFNSDPEVKVFIGHPASGGIGINLTAATYSIFYTRTFSLEYDLQAESRNHRGGSEVHEKITRIDIVAQGTIDEEIQKVLARKEAISEKVLRDVAQRL